MQMQLKLSKSGNNHLEVAITITQHRKQSRTRETNPQVKPEHTTTVQNRQKSIKNFTEPPYENYNNHAKVATPILTWEKSSGNGHNQLPGLKSKQNSNNQLTDQTRTYQNPPEQTRSMTHLTEPS